MVIGATALVGSVALLILCVAKRGDGVELAYAHMGIAAISALAFVSSTRTVADVCRLRRANPEIAFSAGS